MLTITVEGTKQVIDKINKIEKLCNSNDIKEYLANKIISVINRLADERLSYDENYVKSNKYKIEKDGILVYNDVVNNSGEHYSLILEYGSGIYAEKKHIGETDTFKASGYMYWYVPEEKAPELAMYTDSENGKGFEKIETPTGVLYKVYGQTPKHIYEDSAKVVERNVARWISEYIKKELGGKI